MKNVVKTLLKYIVKAIYTLINAVKRSSKRIGGLFVLSFTKSHIKYSALEIANRKANIRTSSKRYDSKTTQRPAITRRSHRIPNRRIFHIFNKPAASVAANNGNTHNKKKIWWKDKRIIAGIGALVIITSVTLALTLPSPGEKAYASVAGAIDLSQTDTNAFGVSEDTEVASFVQYGETSSTISSESIPATAPMQTPVPTTEPEEVELLPGCHDSRIVEIQERLIALGYMPEDEPTDYYGNLTKYGLQLFQRKHSLQIDGIAGDMTIVALFSDDAKPYTLKFGDVGTDVITFQERLSDLNYLSSRYVTGKFLELTEKAVKNFQSRNGLSVDGNIGEKTRDLLNSDAARAASTSSGGSSGGSSSGSSGGSTVSTSVYIEGDPTPEAIIAFAKTKLGCDYSLGSKGPNSFDCSGFVYYCLNQIGYKIGYMTSTSWSRCDLPKVSKMSDMQPGDIICFSPHHVGIYMGNGKMIDASSGNDEVVIRTNILNSSYWTSHFICARRVF